MPRPFKFFFPLVEKAYRWRIAGDKKKAVKKGQPFSEQHVLHLCRESDGSFRSLSDDELQGASQFIRDYFNEKGLTVCDLRLEYQGLLHGQDVWLATFNIS